MNDSTDPDAIVTLGAVFFLLPFATLFILLPPKLSHFFVETYCQCLVPAEFERLLLPHQMPMMMVVAIVVSQNTAVIHTADQWG
jgi:hypothetical protein